MISSITIAVANGRIKIHADGKLEWAGSVEDSNGVIDQFIHCLDKQDCAECGHSYKFHLYPFSARLRIYESWSCTGCDFSAGCQDAGCGCTGYMPPLEAIQNARKEPR